MLHERLKKLMDDIADVAFAKSDIPESIKKKFKWYKLYILPKESDTSNGRYIVNEHTIEIYNARLGGKSMAKCCLHELSHHIDWCINGVTGHKEPFYEVYAKLIYAALDMDILKEDAFNDQWSKDFEKVKEIVKNYSPHPIEYINNNTVFIRVHNSYSIKNQLKENGYRWNGIETVWEKETDDETTEEDMLEKLGAVFVSFENSTPPRSAWYTIEENNMVLDPIVYIEARDWGRRTYDARDELKKQGFFFSGDQKKWLLKIKSDEFEKKIDELKNNPALAGIEFKCQNRKMKKVSSPKKPSVNEKKK